MERKITKIKIPAHCNKNEVLEIIKQYKHKTIGALSVFHEDKKPD